METTHSSTNPLTFRALWHENSTQRSYIKNPTSTHSTPFLWLRVEDFDLGPTAFLGFSWSIHIGYHSENQKKLTKVKSGDMTSPLPSPQTSVCRSMISCPTRGMVVLVFSHSIECSSRGEAARGSRSLRTHAGGDCGIPRTPSHGLSKGACCLSCENTTKRHFSTVVSQQVQIIPDIVIMYWRIIYFMKSDAPITSLTIRDIFTPRGKWNHIWWCVSSIQ